MPDLNKSNKQEKLAYKNNYNKIHLMSVLFSQILIITGLLIRIKIIKSKNINN